MTHQELILAEVARCPSKIREIQSAQPKYMRADIKYLLQRLMYRGKVEKLKGGVYRVT